MLKKLLIFTLCIIGLTALLSFLPIHGETEIYENVLRLHVIANSDSEEDQALKLKVRDAVIEYTDDVFKSCSSKEEAQRILNKNLEQIKNIALNTVYSNGFSYSVSIEFNEEQYPTKNYESCCFPAGEYMSLRIKIGESAGQNWWCVLFPPLCLSAASDNSEAFAQAGITDYQYKVITQTQAPKYKARFKILEVLGEMGKK